jgi:hypothetical protein
MIKSLTECDDSRSDVSPITGSTVLADIELGYALLATSFNRSAAVIQLNEFADTEDLEAEDLLASKLESSRLGNEATVSTSYLINKPYDISPDTFDDISEDLGRLTTTLSSNGERLENITIEDLEAIGKVLRANTDAILEIKRLAGRVEGRADLQVREVGLQLERLRDAMRKVADLRGENPDEDESLLGHGTGGSVDEMKQRYDRITRTQHEIASRLAKVQGKLKNTLQPDLSDSERAWQAEMERVAELLDQAGDERNSSEMILKLQDVGGSIFELNVSCD